MPVGYAHDAIERSDHGLVVGRIQYWKGVTILCEAMRLLNSVALRIDWLGRDTAYQQLGGSMAQYLAQHYPELWSTTIRPIGTLAPDKTRKLQAAAGFILVPSIWDVFNYTCIEGMAQAQTVLCSLGAGASDLITNGVNGFTFTANDPYALAEKLEALFSLSKSERKQIGEAAQQTIQTQLAPAKIAQQRVAAYEKLLHRGKCATRPNPWLVDAVSPGQSLEKPLAFLDLLPLKELSTYILKRSFQKVMK